MSFMDSLLKLGNPAQLLSAAAASTGVVVAIRAINAKRKDERRADRLKRLSRQLSDLYGKLQMLHETGARHWRHFLEQHGSDSTELDRKFRRFFPFIIDPNKPFTTFNPLDPTPEQLEAYRHWLAHLFMKTNEDMQKVILDNADLVVGKEMPVVLADFTEHVASLKILSIKCIEEEKVGNNEFLDDWRGYTKIMTIHPSDLVHYVNASFEVLKEEQERLLSTNDTPLTEEDIEFMIRHKAWKKNVDFRRKEQEQRLRLGQVYELELPEEPKRKRSQHLNDELCPICGM